MTTSADTRFTRTPPPQDVARFLRDLAGHERMRLPARFHGRKADVFRWCANEIERHFADVGASR